MSALGVESAQAGVAVDSLPRRWPRWRILMVSQPTDGGVFNHVLRLGNALSREGHDVVVACPLSGSSRFFAGDVVELDMGRAIDPRADAQAAASVARLVRELRPDVVHAHSSKAGAVARLARLAVPDTPLVYTPHGYAFAGFFESAAARRGYAGVERVLTPLASRILCVCEHERRLAARVGGAARARTVRNGVPSAEPVVTHPEVARLRERGPVIGTVTLLRPGKGVETLIEAMPRLLAEHPTLSLVIAGDGPKRAGLERQAVQAGVADAVHFLGVLPTPWPVLAGLDVFISPSWAESFSYAVLEAMAAGVPVVATDAGGTREAVEDGVTGLLVPVRAPGPLAAGVSRVLADPERRRYGYAGRRRVATEFTLERMVAGTESVYGEVARSNMTATVRRVDRIGASFRME